MEKVTAEKVLAEKVLAEKVSWIYYNFAGLFLHLGLQYISDELVESGPIHNVLPRCFLVDLGMSDNLLVRYNSSVRYQPFLLS